MQADILNKINQKKKKVVEANVHRARHHIYQFLKHLNS